MSNCFHNWGGGGDRYGILGEGAKQPSGGEGVGG